MTIKLAIKKIIDDFDGEMTIGYYELKKLVYREMNQKEIRHPMDSTITARIRDLRKEGYFVECVSPKISMYHFKKL